MNFKKTCLCFNPAISFCLLFCCSLPAAFAEQPGPISTERPSFSASPLTLPAGYWQVETGYQYTRDDETVSFKEHSLPNMLVRFGVHKNLELQLGGLTYKWQQIDGARENGFQDASLGIKWQVNDSDSVVPVGLYGAVSLPVGSSDFSNDSYDPTLGLFWSHSGALNLFGNLILKHADDLFTFDNGVGISFSLPNNMGSYVEYVGSFYEDDQADSTHVMNLGANWLLSDDLQLDINGGFGLNSLANDYYAGMGISYRFR